MADILQSITSLLSPRAAEAKVVGNKEVIALLNKMANNESMSKPESTHRSIVRAASNDNKTVEVRSAPGLMDVYGNRGEYHSGTKKIFYDPTGPDVNKTVAHELIHFLQTGMQGLQSPIEEQHIFINNLLENKPLTSSQRDMYYTLFNMRDLPELR